MKKMIFGAIALAIAVPAAAQAPAAPAPAGDHAEHGKDGHDCKKCCEKMKQHGGKMECMEKKGETKPADAHADHQGHSKH